MDTAGSAVTGSERAPAHTDRTSDDVGPGRVVTVFSSTTGVGTTTVSTNLGVALAEDGSRVCLIDLDAAFHGIADALALESPIGLADAADRPDLDADGVRALLTSHPSGLSVLLAPAGSDDARDFPPAVLLHVLSVLRGLFDFVVVDTPSTFEELVLAAFEASDLIITVATFDVEPLKDLGLTLETLGLLGAPGGAQPSSDGWRILINRVETSAGLAAAEAARNLPVPISAELPLAEELEGAPPPGSPLAIRSPHDPFSVAIQAFADEHMRPALATHPAGARPPGRRRSALRRLWRA